MGETFRPDSTLASLYPEAHVGGYSRTDGQVEFYLRVNSLVDETSRVLDLGAGRGQWAIDPMPSTARRLRHLKGRVAKVVGTDVEEVVRTNPALDEAHVVPLGAPLPFDDGSFDLVIADHVLEHVEQQDAPALVAEVMRVLAPGGWFVARTPNKWGMIGIGARIVPNRLHVRALRRMQPDRKAEDVFPTRYAMNTRRSLRRLFAGHRVVVYTHTSEPTYFGSSPLAWRIGTLIGRLTPPWLAPTLMIFVRRSGGESASGER